MRPAPNQTDKHTSQDGTTGGGQKRALHIRRCPAHNCWGGWRWVASFTSQPGREGHMGGRCRKPAGPHQTRSFTHHQTKQPNILTRPRTATPQQADRPRAPAGASRRAHTRPCLPPTHTSVAVHNTHTLKDPGGGPGPRPEGVRPVVTGRWPRARRGPTGAESALSTNARAAAPGGGQAGSGAAGGGDRAKGGRGCAPPAPRAAVAPHAPVCAALARARLRNQHHYHQTPSRRRRNTNTRAGDETQTQTPARYSE